MHFLMMSLYAALAATVLATVDARTETPRDRVRHGLKIFGAFLAIGLVLSWILFPLPW